MTDQPTFSTPQPPHPNSKYTVDASGKGVVIGDSNTVNQNFYDIFFGENPAYRLIAGTVFLIILQASLYLFDFILFAIYGSHAVPYFFICIICLSSPFLFTLSAISLLKGILLKDKNKYLIIVLSLISMIMPFGSIILYYLARIIIYL